MSQRVFLISTFVVMATGLAGSALAGPPPAPTVTSPTSGTLVNTNKPDITWTGGFHDAYEIHIGFYNTPSSAEGWNSGTVNVGSPVTSVTSAALPVQQTYYVYVRHHNPDGWGPWSQPNVHFYVAGEFLNDPYVVASGGLQWWSDAAYNPARNEYCMTWQNGYVIKWRRLDSTGAVLGIEFTIIDGVTQGHRYSVVCYNSASAEYLILYSGWIDGVGDHMRLLRVNAATGAQIGSTIYLDTIGMNSTTGGLDLAYSPTSNSYIALYEAYSEGNVYSRRLDAFGNPTGSRIQIDTPSQQYSRNPIIAWNSVNNEYLVTYMGLDTGQSWDYWAQRIRASDGALLGSNLQVSTTGDIYNYGGVAYDSNLNRYLVVYDGNSSPPWGQLVSNTASLVGSRFAIGAGTSTGWAPSVCFDSSKREFLVSWSGNQTGTNYSRRVSQAGVPIGDAVSNTGAYEFVGIGNWPPRPVYNSINDEFLIHWYNSYATILDRRYRTFPPPAPDVTGPAPVTGLTRQRFPSSIVLNWTNPSTPDFMGTSIRFKTTGFPAGPTDGVQIADLPNAPSTADTFTHTGLVKGTTYYYAVFAHDEAMNYATGTLASAKIFPGDFDGDDDVDMADFGHLQNCFSGAGVPYGSGCTNADLDEDGDVDQNDSATFLPCLAGANTPPGC